MKCSLDLPPVVPTAVLLLGRSHIVLLHVCSHNSKGIVIVHAQLQLLEARRQQAAHPNPTEESYTALRQQEETILLAARNNGVVASSLHHTLTPYFWCELLHPF